MFLQSLDDSINKFPAGKLEFKFLAKNKNKNKINWKKI